MMRPEDVPADLVEKAMRAMHKSYADRYPDGDRAAYEELPPSLLDRYEEMARHALAAVLPDVQAQALEEARIHFLAEANDAWNGHFTKYGNAMNDISGEIEKYAARLTATTEGTTTT